MIERYDLVVIGSGPAGEKAAVQAAYFGKRVAIVERHELVGGVAVTHVGMIPTKTLREAALYITGFRKRDIYGVTVELDKQQVYATLHKRTNEVIETMSRSVRQNIDRHRIELVRGSARLGGEGNVVVSTRRGGERHLHAGAIIIATGSRPYHPPGIPFDDPDVLDAEGVLEIESPPDRIVVVGGGAIGVEHASIFTALGTRVTLVDRGERLLSYVDAELSHILARSFKAMGMELRLGSGLESVERDEDGLRVVLSGGDEIRPDKLLVASGRMGNTETLDLGAAGVEMDDRGRIIVDEWFRTSAPDVYAAGDVIGPPALASTAMEQGRVAACHAVGIEFKDMVDPSPPTGVYSIPEIAAVGLTEQDASTNGIVYELGRGRFEANSRANIGGATEGMVKLVFAKADRKLLGVHILGENATEAIHVGQAVIKNGQTIDYFIDTTFNVPTLCEAYKYAAYDGLQRLQETT
ncbi:MAG: Si-specific NAD(P)(+) transhydrogenase [Actinomycetota bacterium]